MSLLYSNFYQSNRSELLADYFLSAIGIATPVRRQFDHGIDFYCTLMNQDSQYLSFGYPFIVQVKSSSIRKIVYGKLSSKKWQIENISWLFKNELPFFIAFVDKKKGVINLYDTTGLWQLFVDGKTNCSAIILQPSKDIKTKMRDNVDTRPIPDWNSPKGDGCKHTIDLGNPIINITIEDLNDKKVLEEKKEVLKEAIRIEQENILHRNLGVYCFKEIKNNITNERKLDWGMNIKEYQHPEYAPRILDSLRLPLISLLISLHSQGNEKKCKAIKDLLRVMPPDFYYSQLYDNSHELFAWTKELES